MTDTTHEALEQSLEALQLCLTQLYHDGVMIEPSHPKRIAATAAENCAVKIADILGAANANPVSIPDLTPFITWLENGCDPKEAAKELRIYRNMAKSAVNAAPPAQHEALKKLAAQLESLERVMFACDHTPKRHARRCGEIGREIADLAAANAAEAKPITRYAMTCQFDDAGVPEAIAVVSPNGKFVLYEDYAAPAPVDAQPTKTEPK